MSTAPSAVVTRQTPTRLFVEHCELWYVYETPGVVCVSPAHRAWTSDASDVAAVSTHAVPPVVTLPVQLPPPGVPPDTGMVPKLVALWHAVDRLETRVLEH